MLVASRLERKGKERYCKRKEYEREWVGTEERK
jgi:hypothetical protein